MTDTKIPVYVVVRMDKGWADPEEQISVQAVLPTIEQARCEVERLNRRHDPMERVYFFRTSRYYPDGRAIAQNEPT